MAARRDGLARRRAAMGFTQESLAEHLGIDRSTVGRWERGTLTPQPWNQPDLAGALKISLDTLDSLLAPAASAGQVQPDRVANALGAPHRLDVITVAHLRQRVQQLDQRYDRAPSTSLLADAGLALGQVAFFGHHPQNGRTRLELRELEAEAATLMGQLVWDASQRRDHANARAYFETAIEAARETGNTAAEGHALLRKSYISLYGEHDPRAGLALTEQTAHTTSHTSNVLTALALLHTAEAHAMLGDQSACESALAKAETQFDKSNSQDIAGFLFSPNQFSRMAGSCYLFLGDHRRAQRILEKTACGIRRQNKSRAIVLGNLSLAHLRQGELDAATAALHEAIDVVEETRGGGGLNIVFDAGKELRHRRAEHIVSEVYDRLLSLMTSA
jgi:transcriptional regulator with XRE-family HTH domain